MSFGYFGSSTWVKTEDNEYMQMGIANVYSTIFWDSRIEAIEDRGVTL